MDLTGLPPTLQEPRILEMNSPMPMKNCRSILGSPIRGKMGQNVGGSGHDMRIHNKALKGY